jgi:hypothetical protein
MKLRHWIIDIIAVIGIFAMPFIIFALSPI